jgi:hypothetical protein
LGTAPAGYTYAFDTNTIRQVKLIVSTPGGSGPTNSTPTAMGFQAMGNQVLLSWPLDHFGWTLQIQTNNPGVGLGTNWVAVPGSTGTNKVYIPVDPANGSVFLRLAYIKP